MSTKAQIKANQQNAQKSTGPQTAEGKAVVSQNAIKHGLFAAEAVITGENPADYEAYHDQFVAEMLPVGMVESMMAERIVSLGWRLRRAERMQNQAIEDMIECEVTNPRARDRRKSHCNNERIRPDDPRYDPDHLALGRVAAGDWSYFRVLDRMLLYERRIENSLYKTINKLKTQQVIRRIEIQEVERQQSQTSLSLRDEAATRTAEKKGYLKKQSQSAPGQVDATSFAKEDYDNNPAGGAEENKAKQSQFPAPVQTKGVEKRKKSPGAANLLTG
jgi:hypothetical protein